MKIPPFKLEEFWKKYEFTAPHLLCCSDAESWKLSEILKLASPETKKLWDQLTLCYTETSGLPLLREEIAKTYTSVSSNQIVTFAGAEEGIYCAMRTIVDQGDHVIVIQPCYQSLDTLPRYFGADITTIHLEFEKQWKLSLDDLKKAFRPNTKLLVLNYPHNPTGTLLDKEVFEGAIKLARKCGAYIFSDEVYRYLEVDESKRLPSIVDAYEKGISLNVMTKTFGLAGLRIGWLASRDQNFMHEVLSYKLYTSICNSAVSEILAVIALQSKESILQKNRAVMLQNLHILEQFMQRNRSRLAWVPPQSGMMALLQLKLPIPIEKFAEDLVQKTGVLIMPGTVYDLPGNFFRIGFGRENMPHVLELFENYLRHF